MPTTNLKEQLENIEVEFLHGVPVKLPPKAVDQLLELFNEREIKARMNEIASIPAKLGRQTVTTGAPETGIIERKSISDRYKELEAELLANKDKARLEVV